MWEILLTIAPYTLPVVLGILTVLLIAGAKKLLDKWGIERSDKIDEMIDKYVNYGIDFAEVAATKYLQAQGEKMNGNDKKAKAIGVVLEELKQSGVTGVAEDLISARIESWLKVDGHNPGVPSDPQSGESV